MSVKYVCDMANIVHLYIISVTNLNFALLALQKNGKCRTITDNVKSILVFIFLQLEA